MKVTCTGCGKTINKDYQTYWIVYGHGKVPDKNFCGVLCYRKDAQQEEQKKQALNTPK